LIDAADLGLLYLKVLEDDIRNFVKPEKNIIQDSTILLRSLSYHITMGNEDIVEGLLKLIEIHPKFTKSVLLTASIEKRQERLLQRQKDNPEEVAPDDLLVVEKPNLFMEMEANLIKYSTTYFNSLVIDTTQLSKKEVALAVTQEMAI
jgi:cytidylate kinase